MTAARWTALAAMLLLAAGCIGGDSSTDLRAIAPPMPDPGTINAVIEIPAGTSDKWQVSSHTGALEWEIENGAPRVVDYLAYPANYGMIPGTVLPPELGGDGDPLDVIVLGPALARGSLARARPIGVLRMTDDGRRDDKIIAVPVGGPMSSVTDLDSLESRYPGVLTILQTWFSHYKGPGRVELGPPGDTSDALAIVREAAGYPELSAENR